MCVHFVTCPKQGLEMEAVVLHRVGFLAYFCPKQGRGFQTLGGNPIAKNGSSTPPGKIPKFGVYQASFDRATAI